MQFRALLMKNHSKGLFSMKWVGSIDLKLFATHRLAFKLCSSPRKCSLNVEIL